MSDPMSVEAILSSMIEVAVGVAGFAGIIAAVRQRNLEHWPDDQLILLRILVTASAATILFSLAPGLFAQAGLGSPAVWRACSGALLVWQLVIGLRRVRQVRDSGTKMRAPPMIFVWIVGAALLQAANLRLALSWPYLLGVLSLLANGFAAFVGLLFGASAEREPQA